MSIHIRPADLSDMEQLADLLLADAKARYAADPVLWAMDSDPRPKIIATLRRAIEADAPAFRQMWLVAETNGDLVGVAHSILLPVPPIYAGVFGPPGLIMEDCFVAPHAPADTQRLLLVAAEADLVAAGAQILLGSSVARGAWEPLYHAQGYEPLTMYFAKTGLSRPKPSPAVRKAQADDIPGIVALSAMHRQRLVDLHSVFWEPHPQADSRFGAWMQRSLTLTDRDMFVSDGQGHLTGYAISQPATPLHFPTPHDISGVGVIDDFFHDATDNVRALEASAPQAAELLRAAEAARAARGNTAVLVVCPAAWSSKIRLLTDLGYNTAITWHFKQGTAAT